MSGVQQSDTSFDAQATIDDTRSGFCASHPDIERHSPRQYLGCTVAVVPTDRSVHTAPDRHGNTVQHTRQPFTAHRVGAR